MFRKITIIRLLDNNSLLNFSLRWPAKCQKKVQSKDDIELLRYAGVLKGNLASALLDGDQEAGYKTIMVPVNGSDWLTDITDVQYESLTKMIKELFPNVSSSPSKQCWYLPQPYVEHDLVGQDVEIKELNELEVSLYAHGVNQSRGKYQQKKITGFRLGAIGEKARQRRLRLVGGSNLISLFYNQVTLQEWLEKPYVNCMLVMGKESGDQELYRVKETVLHMMETGQCDMVEVIQKNSHDVYAASWFYKLYSEWKDYIFSKQAI